LKAKFKKYLLIVVFIVVLSASAAFIGVLNGFVQNEEKFTPHFLSYMEKPSKIFVASVSTLRISDNQTHLIGSSEIAKGAELLQFEITLRNDYSIENPPPPTSNIPIAPIDGTAYLILTITLYNKDGAVTPTILSPSDFSVTSSNQIGLILASGQTNNLTLMLTANNVDINKFDVNLVFLGDSIQN
jgi:hypothetical protein